MIKRGFMWLVMLILYVSIGIPIINRFLIPMMIDFVNNYGHILVINYTTIRYTYTPNQSFTPHPEIITLDLKPLVVILIQLFVYIILPIIMVIGVIRR